MKPGLGSGSVAFFLPSLRGGGAERVMLTLASEFSRVGVRSSLLLAKAEGPLLPLVPPGVSVVDLGHRRVLRSLPRLAQVPSSGASRRRDICHDPCQRSRAVGQEPCRSPHPYDPDRAQHALPGVAVVSHDQTEGDAMVRRVFYPWADEIVAVSRGVADDLAQVAGVARERIDVIYNPLVSDSLRGQAEQPVDHPWFGTDKAPVILGVGRLTPQKDFATLINAFATVACAHPANLMILGEGSDRESLQRLVEDLELAGRVTLPGYVENPLSYMRRAAVVVLSSAWEGFPSVLVEALACGTPVVSTNCPSGPSEILENGDYGLLVPVGDADALAVGIECTLKGKPDTERLRRRAGNFGVRASVESYLNLLPASARESLLT